MTNMSNDSRGSGGNDTHQFGRQGDGSGIDMVREQSIKDYRIEIVEGNIPVHEASPLLQEHGFLKNMNVDPMIHDGFNSVEGGELAKLVEWLWTMKVVHMRMRLMREVLKVQWLTYK